MNCSAKAEAIFSRAQRGISNSFVGGIQKGIPPTIHSGGICGEITEFELLVLDANGKRFQMREPVLLGEENTLFLIDQNEGNIRFSLIVDGCEMTAEEQIGSCGWLRIIAMQRLGVPFAILAEWDQRPDREPINSMLSGADDAFIQHVHALIRLKEGENQ
jgi:hypothetical protein